MHLAFSDVILMLLGFAGFLLAHNIWHKKHKKKPLICPMRSNCNVVVTSRYSKLLGIPVEILGMAYYAGIVILHAVIIVHPDLFSLFVVRLSLVVSTFAFIFSLYLTSIQAFVLRQWCVWCLTSAGLCALIFLGTYLASPAGIF